MTHPARRSIIQTHDIGLLLIVQSAQGIARDLFCILLVTFSRAVHLCLTGVRDFGDRDVALIAAKLTVRGSEVLLLVDMEHLDFIRFFQPHQPRVLVAGEATALVQSKARVRHRSNKAKGYNQQN